MKKPKYYVLDMERYKYLDRVEAQNKVKACELFFERLPEHLKDYLPPMLYAYIAKDEVTSAYPDYLFKNI